MPEHVGVQRDWFEPQGGDGVLEVVEWGDDVVRTPASTDGRVCPSAELFDTERLQRDRPVPASSGRVARGDDRRRRCLVDGGAGHVGRRPRRSQLSFARSLLRRGI
jgi:hypothetical protein